MVSDGDARKVGRTLLSLLALAGLLWASTVVAEPSSADKETARNLLREGDEKFAIRDFAGALKAYQAAHALMQVPTTGLPLAKAQIERGLLVEARDTLLQVSRYPKEPSESLAFAKAREDAGPLAQKLAERIPSIAITVEGPPKGASIDVTVDGVAVPAAALGAPLKLNPGLHVIRARTGGFQAIAKNVTLKEGDNDKLALKLVPGAGGPPPPGNEIKGGGRIHVVSSAEPGNVFIDGKAVGVTPLDVPITGGVHTVQVEYPGGSREERKVDVATGATLELSFQPSPMDAAARHRKGIHLGFAVSPSMAALLEGGPPIFGGGGSFVLNIGITPILEFRTGASAAFLFRTTEVSQLSVVVPAMLRINYTPWFSVSAGLSAGFATTFDEDRTGLSIGPEWTLLSMSAGDKRQFELSVAQGLRFGDTQPEYHQSVVFTYLFVD
jgi:hypothetical protein